VACRLCVTTYGVRSAVTRRWLSFHGGKAAKVDRSKWSNHVCSICEMVCGLEIIWLMTNLVIRRDAFPDRGGGCISMGSSSFHHPLASGVT
jgi:hypothetical protein